MIELRARNTLKYGCGLDFLCRFL